VALKSCRFNLRRPQTSTVAFSGTFYEMEALYEDFTTVLAALNPSTLRSLETRGLLTFELQDTIDGAALIASTEA